MITSDHAGAPPKILPLELRETDFLGVEFDPENRIFLMRPRSLTSNPEQARVGSSRYTVRGTVMFDHWSDPSPMATTFFRDLPEVRYEKKRERYVTPAVDSTAIFCVRSWGMSRIVFISNEAEMEFERLLTDFSVGEAVAVQAARFKLDGTVPQLPSYWQERKDRRLSPYQRVAVKLSLDVPGLGLFMDRGTGKTACAVQRVCTLAQMLERGEIDGGATCKDGSKMLRVLVIVPKNVRLNWQREFEKFAHVAGKVAVVRGGMSRRIRCIADAARPDTGYKFSVLIASYDNVRTTEDYISLVPWDDVITDESHAYKDPNTQRFKSIVKVRDVSARRLSLTGSPIGNSPGDLWSQLEFLREGGSGFTSRKMFRQYHGVFETIQNGAQGIQKLVGLQNIPLLQERLSRMTFSVTKEEAGLNLPDKVRSVIEVQMTPYQADVYNRLQDELALEIEDKLSGEVVDEVTIRSVLTMLLRLAQITSGFITYDAKIDPDNGDVIVPKRVAELSPENPKIEALVELLQDPDRDTKAKTIVWCHFIHNIETVSKKLTDLGIKHGCYYGAVGSDDRDRIVDAFNNDPEFKVLICNPQTAGEGLNLVGYDVANPDASDTYCDLEVFFSSGWSAILRSQAEDRAHRRGTRMPVQVIDLVVPGSIDEEIINRVVEKREMAETVVDLRSTMSRILGIKVDSDE